MRIAWIITEACREHADAQDAKHDELPQRGEHRRSEQCGWEQRPERFTALDQGREESERGTGLVEKRSQKGQSSSRLESDERPRPPIQTQRKSNNERQDESRPKT